MDRCTTNTSGVVVGFRSIEAELAALPPEMRHSAEVCKRMFNMTPAEVRSIFPLCNRGFEWPIVKFTRRHTVNGEEIVEEWEQMVPPIKFEVLDANTGRRLAERFQVREINYCFLLFTHPTFFFISRYPYV